QPRSDQPRSSARIKTMFGDVSAAKLESDRTTDNITKTGRARLPPGRSRRVDDRTTVLGTAAASPSRSLIAFETARRRVALMVRWPMRIAAISLQTEKKARHAVGGFAQFQVANGGLHRRERYVTCPPQVLERI